MSASRPMASSQETKFKAKFAARFIDCLKERGVEAEIEPFRTLMHTNLPTFLLVPRKRKSNAPIGLLC